MFCAWMRYLKVNTRQQKSELPIVLNSNNFFKINSCKPKEKFCADGKDIKNKVVVVQLRARPTKQGK